MIAESRTIAAHAARPHLNDVIFIVPSHDADTGFGIVQATLIHDEADTGSAAAQLGHASEDVTDTYYIAKPALAPDVSEILEQLSDDPGPISRIPGIAVRNAPDLRPVNGRSAPGGTTTHMDDKSGCRSQFFWGFSGGGSKFHR